MMKNLEEFKVNLERQIKQSNGIVIVPHNNVDLDALGSAIGISLIAKKFKKTFYIIINDIELEHGVSMLYEEVQNEYPIITLENYEKLSSSKDLFILTDVNKESLVCLDEKDNYSQKIFIIDHHNEDEFTFMTSDQNKLIDSDVSSACEIVTELLKAYDIDIPCDVANYLLAGIYLDTNKLSNNATPETMRVVANLLDTGANLKKVTDYFTEDFISDRRVQSLVSRTKIIPPHIAIAASLEDDIYTKEEIAKVADYLLKYQIDAAFAIGNIGDRVISISARSKEKINVGDMMKEFGGGGNQYSGAAKINDCSVSEVNKQLLKVIKKSVIND